MEGSEVPVVVRDLCEAVAEKHGLELVEVALSGSRHAILSVILDGIDEPIGIEEVTNASEEISRGLDLLDPIESRYTLEVSSPGIERPLTKPVHFEKYSGSEIKVKFRVPVDGHKNLRGKLEASSEQSFVLATPEGTVEIPYESVERAKLVVDWDAEFARSNSGD